jgi:hypothetical protein
MPCDRGAELALDADHRGTALRSRYSGVTHHDVVIDHDSLGTRNPRGEESSQRNDDTA